MSLKIAICPRNTSVHCIEQAVGRAARAKGLNQQFHAWEKARTARPTAVPLFEYFCAFRGPIGFLR
ncbi:hypothetical protein [Methylobacter sp.]|uniref:hypothetical protein n=1 Tax=Methylobacter sp. TaxID=2051955 RepID=UPI0025F815FE|nr:hypothetical protein [Methylobacter sp.]